MLLVASLGVCDREQDVAFLAGLTLCQTPVHGGFGSFVGQVLAPAPELRLSFGPHMAIIA